MDIFVKKAIIHQFSPDDTELVLSDQLLTVSPKIEEYLRKRLNVSFLMKQKQDNLTPIILFLTI